MLSNLTVVGLTVVVVVDELVVGNMVLYKIVVEFEMSTHGIVILADEPLIDGITVVISTGLNGD